MIPNLKVDIIYYNTQSDFEMEFNLSGYCRMRIFKSTANTPEELITSLATDLDRSQIIIVVSDVLGKNCGVTVVSDAVGIELESADKDAYNISSPEEIFVPKNAVPLVSASGAYGGCILESGLQSIIMITDNRALRHEIMKSLVHQYIFDISQLEAYKIRQQISEDKVSTEPEKVSEPETENTDAAPEGFSIPVASTENTISNSIFSAPGTNLVINPPQDDTVNNEEEAAKEEPPATKPLKKKKSVTDILLLIIVVFLLIAFGIMAYFFVYIPLVGGNPALSNSGNDIFKAIETWLFN